MTAPHLVLERPVVENTIRNEEYVTSAPDVFSLTEDDKHVLHAGGFYHFKVLDISQPEQHVVGEQRPELIVPTELNVAVYILNKSVIIWFPNGRGLEIPYQSILLHAKQDDHLYLQMESNQFYQNPHGYIECVLNPISEDIELEIELKDKLFNTSSTSLGLYEAMSRCLAMNLDEEDENEEDTAGVGGAQFGGGEFFMAPNLIPSAIGDGNSDNSALDKIEVPASWLNHGTADDLDEMDVHEGGLGGMDVDIGQGPAAGFARKRGNSDGEIKRKRI